MQPLFIGPYQLGVQQNLKPFMIPDTAFPNLLNAFVFRGRVQRKPGYRQLGRLRRAVTGLALGNTDGGGALAANLLTTFIGVAPNASIQVGSVSIVVGAQTFTDAARDGTLSNGGAGTGTINYSTGAITLQTNPVLAGTPATAAFGYFPNLPVMGIRPRENPLLTNQNSTVFFDTVFAYRFQGTNFEELPSNLPVTWSGTDSQFFWTTNYQFDDSNNELFWATNNSAGNNSYLVTLFAGAAGGPPDSTVSVTTATANNFQLGDTVSFTNLKGAPGNKNNLLFGTVTTAGNPFVLTKSGVTNYWTNGAVTGIAASSRLIDKNTPGQDGIRVYSNTGPSWRNFNPIVNAKNVLVGARFLIPYKGRLVALLTQEGNDTDPTVTFRQRVRWSQNGSAIDQAVGWVDVTPGRGGFLDAPTGESIVAAGFVKDQLIVYFERSSWALVYTGNEILPFIFQRIDSQLGSSAPYSAVPFDNGILTFGNVGVHQCNGQTCQRIDEVIPDEIFRVKDAAEGPTRTYGIRNYLQECVYWAYADDEDNTDSVPGKIFYPSKMMVYNYRNNTFSFFDDHATCFGYFQNVTGIPWSGITWPWTAWNTPWNSGLLQSEFPDIAFGNQQGFVEIITPVVTSNDRALYIQNMVSDPLGARITSPQHNLFVGQYVTLNDIIGLTPLVGLNLVTFQVVEVIDANTIVIDAITNPPIGGAYKGGGTMTPLSNIVIQTKQFTPFWEKGKRYELRYIDMLFDKTSTGEMTVNVYIDFNNTDSMTSPLSGVLMGNNIVSTTDEGSTLPYYSFLKLGTQIWKRFYTQAMGETFQLDLSFSDAEMRSIPINYADVVLHGLIFYFAESGEFY